MAAVNGRQVSWARRLWLVGVAVGMALAACSGQSSPESVGQASQALTSAQQGILGFESVGPSSTDWTTSSGTLSQSTRHVEGAGSLAIANGGNAEIKSAALSSLGPVADKITLDLLLPAAQPNPYWMGTLKVVLECPSQQLSYEALAEYQLQGKPTEQFLRFEFPLSATTQQKLSTGAYSDLRIRVLLNVPSGAGPWLLDRLSIGETSGGGGGGSGGVSGSGGLGGAGMASGGQAGSSSSTSNNAAILGFESPALWSGPAGILSSSDVRLEGSHALQVADVSYVELTSAPLTTLGPVSSVIGFDLSVPNPEGDVGWWGTAAVSLDCPSRGINNRWIGQQELNGAALDRFRRVEAVLPDDVKAALSTGTYADLRLKVILTVPAGSGPYLLDRFTFNAQLPEPAPPAPSDAVDKALGMETLESWKATAATLRLSSEAAERASSLAVSDFQYTEVSSTRLSSLGTPLKNELTFDVWIPVPPTPYWAGTVAASISIPSKGINSQVIGQQDVLPLEKATWQRIRFPLTAALVSALQGSYSDLRVSFALNRPAQPEAWKLDGVSFGQKSLSPPSPAFTESYVVPLPSGSTFGTVAIGQALVRSAPFFRAGGSIDVLGSSLTTITRPDGQFSEVVAPRGIDDDEANVLIGLGASVGSVAAFRNISNDGTVHGSARAGGELTGVGALTGTSAARADLLSREAGKLTVTFPNGAGAADVTVDASNPAASPAPGASYDFVSATTTGSITLRTGSYYINHLSIGRGTELRLDNGNGPIFVYVRDSFLARGSVSLLDHSKWNVVFVVTARDDLKIAHDTHFEGTIVAPKTSQLRIDPINDPSEPAYTAGSFFARAVFAGYKIEHHPFVRDDCGAGSCGVFGCDTADRDGDGLYDCQEQSDGDPFTDPDRFNGLRAYGYRSGHRSVDPTAIDTQAKVDASIVEKFEEHDIYSGWNLDGQALLDVGCRREMEFWPPWPVCHEASYPAFNYSGFIKLATSGQHCFEISQTSTSIAGALFLGDEPTLTSSDGKRCMTLDAGVYPLRFMVEVTGLQDVNSLRDDKFKVAYCRGDCTPTVAIPSEMLRPAYPGCENGCATPCTSAAECLIGDYCSQGGQCRTDGDVCATDSQCPAQQRCAGGACVPGCTSNADCGVDEFCSVSGSCKPDSTPCDPAAMTDCRPACPCATGAQCGNDRDCRGELACGLNAGPAFGAACGTNACVRPICTTSPTQGGCGYSNAPCGACDVTAACEDEPQCEPTCANKHCGDDPDDGCSGACIGFCSDRDPGCKTDADCPSGDACIRGGGPRVGLATDVNVCLPKVCAVPNRAVATCGAIDDLCGICPPAAADACGGRECGVDPTSGVACGPAGVACVDGKIVRKFGPGDVDLSSGERNDFPELQIPALPVVEPLADFTNIVPGAVAGAFDVDARGAATYAVPITVPPGRAGMQPELALVYNSRGGNGIAGMGWSVNGLSTIARCARSTATDGARIPVRYDETDALCLDGARLIYVPQYGTQEGHRDAEYRTEIDSFQKVVLRGPGGPAGTYFVAYRKDGQIWEYGRTDKERLFRDPAPRPRVPRAWALSKIRDRAGNVISFSYGKIESSESRSYASVSQETVELFPDEIAYGGFESAIGTSSSRLKVKFNYVDGRRDYMEGFSSAGARITRTKLLQSIETFVADQPVRSYELSYVNATSGLDPVLNVPASGPSRVDGIHECSKKNGVRVCLPATKLTYSDERGFVPNTVVASAPPLLGPLVTMDANGDGVLDFLALGRTTDNVTWNPAPTTVLIGNGSRSAPEFTTFSITPKVEVDPFSEDPTYPCFSQASVVDIDGDGRDELVDLCPHYPVPGDHPEAEHYYWIYRFDGLGAPKEVEAVTVNSLSQSKPRAFLVDANGDGVVDLFECTAPDGNATRGEAAYFAGRRGEGAAFEAQPSGRIASTAMQGNCGIFNYPKAVGRPIGIRPAPIVVQDVTGDGTADLMIHDLGEPPNRGESLVSTSAWYRYTISSAGVANWEPVYSDRTPGLVWTDSSNFKFLDVNGDGLRDLVTLSTTPELALNQGGTFASVGPLFPPNVDPNLVRRLTAYSLRNSVALDYDGDGAEDLLRLMDYKSEPAAAVSHWLWDRANTAAQSYGTLELDRAPLNLSDPNSFFLTIQPKIPPPVEIGGPTQTVADADGDGSVDLIQLRAGGGIAITYGRFGHENLLSSVTDGLGKRVDVKYDSRSTFSDGSAAPTYQVAPPVASRDAETPGLCAPDDNTRCIAHVGAVVSSYRVTGSAGEYGDRPDVAFHFRYQDARQGLRGRGWLGFSKVIIDKAQATFPETPIERTEVTRDNRTLVADGYLFPFAGRETSRVTTTPFAKSAIERRSAAHVETTTTTWEALRSTRHGLFPVARTKLKRSDELFADGTIENVTQVAVTAVDVDGFGNVLESQVATAASGNWVSLQTVTMEFDGDPFPEDTWLIALPTRRSVVEELGGGARLAAGKPDEERVTSWQYNDDGLLDYMVREPGEAEDSGLYLKTTFNRFEDLAPNPAHNVRNVTTSGSWTDADGQVTTGTRAVSFQYDSDAIAPRRVIRHVGNDCPVNSELGDTQESGFGSTCLIEDMKFDPRDGTMTGGVDATGVGFQMSYDAFGRILSRETPDEETVFSYQYGTPSFDARLRLVPTSLEVIAKNKTTGGTSTRRIDSLGRTVQVESSGLDGDTVFQETAYEWGQMVDRISRPHLEGDASQRDVRNLYDARWRLTERRFPDDTSVGYLYAAAANVTSDVAVEADELWVSGSIDQNTNRTFKLTNFRGSPLRVIDEKGNSTRYAYDAFGTLSTITDAAGNLTMVTTDALGRVTSHEDGDTGRSTTTYTAFDEMFEFTDGVGTEAPRRRVHEYDDAGRLVVIDAPEGLTSFSYDQGPNAMGRLVETESPSGNVEHYDYQEPTEDPLSNLAYLKGVTRQIGGASFTTGLTYDPNTHLLEKVDLPPSSDGKPFAVHYEYDDVGLLKAVKGSSSDGNSEDAPFWERGANYQGQAIATETFGNGVTSSYGYEDKTGRLKSLTTKDPADVVLQDFQYTLYDGNGNLKTRTSSFRDVGASALDVVDESFGYDELDRLTTITGGASATTVGYDAIGNITAKSGLGTYGYAEAGKVARPHAVQNVKRGSLKILDLEYDDYGNVTHRSGDGVEGDSQEIFYSSFNLPTQVTLGGGSQVRYQYDASQSRVVVDVGDCTEPTSATCNRRVYAGEAYERQTATDEAGAFTRDLYKVFAGGQQVAQVQRESRNASSTETRRFIHGDHLGSSQLITDEEGNVASLRRFNAFGELTAASSPDAASSSIRSGFTGHEMDVETGLVNMRGRIYDPKLARFLQADVPFAESPLWSQGLNRYSYVFNNPLRFTDPSGVEGEDEAGDARAEEGFGVWGCSESGSVCTCLGTPAECGDGPPDSAAGEDGASSDPSGNETQAMDESSESASNATSGTPGDDGPSAADIAREVAHTGSNATLGYGEGAVPFASLWSAFNPPSNPRDRFERGAGQLAGSVAAFGEAGAIAGAGALEAVTVIGIPPAIATEVAAAIVGVGAIANAATGLYNMMMGDSGGGSGRAGKQERLEEIAKDPNTSRADRGWIKQEQNAIERGNRTSIRNPPGKDLAHSRGREAAKGYSHTESPSNLQDRSLHKTQHKFDNFGRKNPERP